MMNDDYNNDEAKKVLIIYTIIFSVWQIKIRRLNRRALVIDGIHLKCILLRQHLSAMAKRIQ